MRFRSLLVLCFLASPAALAQTMSSAPAPAAATDWPVRDGVFDIPNFAFRNGETIAALHLHYLTLGTLHHDSHGHADNAVLLLHGTGGDARSLLNPKFSNELFGPGQPLDIARYFIILPDDIGHGASSKPSDGLRMRFPAYDYDDMVASQHAMLVGGLHVDHLRLLLGTSMGCMQAFTWAETYPAFPDAIAGLACLPVEIAGRNRMMRYMAMDAIRRDPAWKNGAYESEPLLGLRTAAEMLFIMGSSPLQMQKDFPTRVAAEQRVDEYLDRAVAHMDANDLLYYVNASRNYNPANRLEAISAPLLWINSADDFINPPELGIAERTAARIPHARFVLLPITEQTRGHGTHTMAAVWKGYLAEFLAQTERRR
jgi:homoserine O-acetyltransferase